MSRRAIVLLTTMIATLVAASGVAFAATINCQAIFVCNGTSQSDALIGSAGEDIIHGLGGNDLLLGLAEHDTLLGDEGRDQLLGGSSTDELYGGPGNDVSNGGAGPDTYFFEANNWGQDTIYENRNFDSSPNRITIGLAVTANLQIFLHADNTTNPEVSNAGGIPGTNYTVNWSRDIIQDVFNNSSGNDIIFGNDGANFLFSHSGADQVYGAGGDDFINVQDFALSSDYVDCGPGTDTVFVDKLIVADIGTLPADIVKNCEQITS